MFVDSHSPHGEYDSTIQTERVLAFFLDEERLIDLSGNCIRRECGAIFKGKALEGKPQECQGYETRSQGGTRSKPLRG